MRCIQALRMLCVATVVVRATAVEVRGLAAVVMALVEEVKVQVQMGLGEEGTARGAAVVVLVGVGRGAVVGGGGGGGVVWGRWLGVGGTYWARRWVG